MWNCSQLDILPQLHTAASFAETVQGLGHQHQDKTDDPDAMTKQFTVRVGFLA